MSSPSKEEAGLTTPPKSNSLENTALNIESILEANQKVEAPKLPKQEQKVPNPLTGSDFEHPDKELFFGAWIREDMEKHTKYPQGTKTQEPTMETQEDVQEGKQTDDAVPP
ncbi:hypothetical protein FDENT_5921 [Fusarium denticulatum]|uniref:Uncharacterized protein n=1 Tax=Fusarium denticulatum TaxID=48507 RepID=A0A8H5UF90_9HYPO|nr:hypothetical protein FDENT_5921 [Fusarium denticulatum]